ncbi:MAG: phospho-sugar mutase [Hyphomicrobiales bacterium]
MTLINKDILSKAQEWLTYDPKTKEEVQNLIDNNPKELVDSFYKDLEFGTGGMRGIMGAGSNRMNKYTVGAAAQGLANYIIKSFPDEELKAAIAYDCRNNSPYFAEITAQVLSANGIKVYLFTELRPTPELSFTIRHLSCQSGVVITASHNPKEYNGFKAYWQDGGQLISPHDKNVIEEVQSIHSLKDIKFEGNKDLIIKTNEDIDNEYLERVCSLSLSRKAIDEDNDIPIVFTALHGTGGTMIPRALKKLGFKNISTVKEQDIYDGNFPTVASPNPEETSALQMALDLGEEVNAELVMGTDPDADRVGIAVRNKENKLTLLNGNQAASILIYYLLSKWSEDGKLTGNEYIAKTIVTTELLKDIADSFKVKCFDVLTGFKYIADLIHKNEGKMQFIGGGEESYGYLVGEFIRDKDAVISCTMFAEIAAWAKSQGKTIYDILIDIYTKHACYLESLVSLVKKGKEGSEEIQKIMATYRNAPPKKIADYKVVQINDYSISKSFNIKTGEEKDIDLPKSNVLQFFTEDGSKISVRPSGTEPKIKYYISVKLSSLESVNIEDIFVLLEAKVQSFISDLGIE